MTNPVSIRRQGAVGVILIDNPPVNALSTPVRQGILDSLQRLVADDNISAVVIACAGRTFVAGADLSEFDRPPEEPHLPEVMYTVSDCPKPVVAALHGSALGGGFELALACHYRVAAPGTRVGFPEVNIGLIPGAGGTQLLPRLVGVERALEIITSGRPLPARDLAGAISAEVGEKPLPEAVELASGLARKCKEPRRLSERAIVIPKDAGVLIEAWRQKLATSKRGQDAPQRAVDAIKNALELPFEEAVAKEREIFLELRESAQARAMRHAFFAERAAGKVTGLARDAQAADIGKVAVIGAGTMGTGIAVSFAAAGFPVTLLEQSADNLLNGLAAIDQNYQGSLARGRISAADALACKDRIHGTTDEAELAGADLVVEAAFERLDVKQGIFRRLGELCREDTILATNTSYLDIDKIAKASNRPEQVVGMHFFSPAHIMKLLEVVRATETSPMALKTAVAIGKRIGKIPVSVGLCYGFVGNRMYACYGREANMLLLEGATPAQVDRAMTDWGMAMGPLAVADLAGIDIGYLARRESPDLPDDPLYFRASDLLAEAGRLGRKSGAGFYRYGEDPNTPLPDEEVIALIRAEAMKLGATQRDDIGEEEIQQRLVFALVNEGARILEEGIAARASDIDVIWLNGYGFPRWRGGPMCYADEVGQDRVVAGIEGFRDQLGDRYWAVAPLLQRLLEQGESLAAYENRRGIRPRA